MKKYAMCLLLGFLCLNVQAQKLVKKTDSYLLVFSIDQTLHLDPQEKEKPDIKTVILNNDYAVFHALKETNGKLKLDVTVLEVFEIQEETNPEAFFYTLKSPSGDSVNLRLIVTDEGALLSLFVNQKAKMTLTAKEFEDY